MPYVCCSPETGKKRRINAGRSELECYSERESRSPKGCRRVWLCRDMDNRHTIRRAWAMALLPRALGVLRSSDQ